MGLEQKLLQDRINNNEIIVQCCITGLFRTIENSWIGFRLKEPYAKISHTYHPDEAYTIKKCMEYEFKQLKNNITLK